MKFIKLPPQEVPKQLTAYARAKTLGEHMQAFLSQHIRDSTEEELNENNSDSVLPMQVVETVLDHLKNLHAQKLIQPSDIEHCADKIKIPGIVSQARARKIVRLSFGFKNKSDFNTTLTLKLSRLTYIDKSKTLTLYQALFYDMIQTGLIKSPGDVKLSELLPYAFPELISILQQRSDETNRQRAISYQKCINQHDIIQNKIIDSPNITLTQEEIKFVKNTAIDWQGKCKNSFLLKPAKFFNKAETEITPFEFNWLYIHTRTLFLKKSISRKTKKSKEIEMIIKKLEEWLEQHPFK